MTNSIATFLAIKSVYNNLFCRLFRFSVNFLCSFWWWYKHIYLTFFSNFNPPKSRFPSMFPNISPTSLDGVTIKTEITNFKRYNTAEFDSAKKINFISALHSMKAITTLTALRTRHVIRLRRCRWIIQRASLFSPVSMHTCWNLDHIHFYQATEFRPVTCCPNFCSFCGALRCTNNSLTPSQTITKK